MVKRTSYLVFLTFVMFCAVQPVFAVFSVAVENKSDIVYKSIDLVITPVGFDASYGRVEINEEIGPRERKDFEYGYKYLLIPLTGTHIPSEGCDLDIMVVANPKQDSAPVQTRTYKKVLSMLDVNPQIIREDSPREFPSQPPLRGIQPPNMRITLTNGVDSTENINVVFTVR